MVELPLTEEFPKSNDCFVIVEITGICYFWIGLFLTLKQVYLLYRRMSTLFLRYR
nr:MAG TPA: hypothetical protein [Caudoviricetes sp.]